MYVHRVIAEMKIGRLLGEDEVVHHKDGNKTNNSPENLEVLTLSDHSKHHSKDAPLIELLCAQCGKNFPRPKRRRQSVTGSKNVFCSYSCNGKFNGELSGFAKVSGPTHGTVSGYRYHRCRCEACRAASTASSRRWREGKSES